jgi:hypothetical protein
MEIGNNIASSKFYRAIVPLVSETNNSFDIQGKYFFPELKNLEGKKINGIQVHFGGQDITLKANVKFQNKDLWFVDPIIFTGLNTFLTLYDIEGNELIGNMPTAVLFNQNLGGGADFNKIIPFNAVLNIRKSYVLVPEVYNSTPPIIPALTLTFFHD